MGELPAPLREIETVTFGIAGDEENDMDATVQVTSVELFEEGGPARGGPFDPRMGTTDHHITCETCGHGRNRDPGHLGKLKSKSPLPSPVFVAEIRRWLRVVCINSDCGAPVIDPAAFARFKPESRLAEAAKKVMTSKNELICARCGQSQPRITDTDDDNFSVDATYPATAEGPPRTERLTPARIRAIFDRVTDETARAFGRGYPPRKLMPRIIAIPPVTIRPALRLGYGRTTSSASNSDLTTLTQYLVKQAGDIIEDPPESGPAAEDNQRRLEMLQQLYYDMVAGSPGAAAGGPPSGGRRATVLGSRKTQSIMARLPQKRGTFRRNLLGKRVWEMSRSTISGNPSLGIDEVGIPLLFARTLQITETVQEFNLRRLMGFFRNGETTYPGCSRVYKRATGAAHRVGGLRADFRLEIGDRIDRDVVDGDYAYFNRQPTLERSSIGAHRVVVLRDPTLQTIQMNVSACNWYNADFDGDQMNLWVAQNPMTRCEASIISAVKNWFISTKSSGPVPGQVQDGNIGSFELTRSSVRMDRHHVMRLFSGTGVPPPDLSGDAGRIFEGREVVSLLFAGTPVNFDRPTSWYQETLEPFVDYDPTETHAVMRRGKLVKGVLDKKSVGAGAGGGLFHQIARQHGSQKALDMIFALQQMAVGFAGARGFTVSADDMIIPPARVAEVHAIIAGAREASRQITDRLERGDLLPPIGMTTYEYYEKLQIEALKPPDELLRPIVTEIDPDWNGLFQMIVSGSKGSVANLLHIMGSIGQVVLNTRRIEENFAFRRASPYHPRFATDPEAYGFVENCYVSGMTASEFIFSAMNGRFDLINKALSTASTGYLNRKAVLSLQSDVVDNHRRVMTDQGVVQSLYGEDGLDARGVENARFRVVFLSDDRVRADFGAPGKTAAVKAAVAAAIEALIAGRDQYRRLYLASEDTDFKISGSLSDSRQVPVNVAQIIKDVQIARRSEGGAPAAPIAGAELARSIETVRDFCERLPYVFLNSIREKRGDPIPEHFKAATFLVRLLVQTELAPAALQEIPPADLALILDRVRMGFANALVDYGTAAGVLAAQAVSEPLTQYMLDSHHRSVGSGTNKSGIVRPQEIFAAKPPEAEQSAEMLLRVVPEIETNRPAVLQIANRVELMELSIFVKTWAILLEPYGRPVAPAYADDRAWLDEFAKLNPLLTPPDDLTSWCIRFELAQATLILKSLDLETVVERLRAMHPQTFVAHSFENSERVVIRVYLRASLLESRTKTAEDRRVENKVLAILEKDLLPTVIRGIPGIRTAAVDEIKRHRVGPDGALTEHSVFAIRTTGSNIAGVLGVAGIDARRIVSSSIGDTAKVFGLVAARQAIIREIERFVEGTNPRHLMIYADTMTRTGRVTSLETAGVRAREPDNVLLSAGMSGPAQVLQSAALNGSSGSARGMIPSFILGATPRIGTGANEFIVDTDFVQKNRKGIDAVLDDL